MKKILHLFGLIIAATPIYNQQIIDDTIQAGGLDRAFKLYIPASYNGSTSVPLVLNLHGLGSNSFEQMYYSNFMPIADTANFIIVHPQGTYEPTILQSTYWNAEFPGSSIDDVGFLSDLIDTLSNRYNIDANRVHSTGMSNGGYMSLVLACQLNDKIASVASVTGTMTTQHPSSCSGRALSIMQIHGTADGIVPYNGDANSQSVQSVLNLWINHNNTSSMATIDSIPNINTADNCYANRYTYSGGTDNTEVIHYKITGGGHTWPGASTIVGVTNQDFSASSVIWDFFNRNTKNGSNPTSINKEDTESFDFKNLNDKLIITNQKEASLTTYSIFDMSGKMVLNKVGTNQNETIDIANLAEGIYSLTVENRKNSQFNSFKFIKN